MTGRKTIKMRTAAAAFAVSVVGLATSGCEPVADEMAAREATELASAMDRARAATQSLGEKLMAALGRQLEPAALRPPFPSARRLRPPRRPS